MTTVTDLLLARADDDGVALRTGDDSWTWREVVAAARTRAELARPLLDPARPPHVGLLLPNVPEYVFWLGAAALAGLVVVGINPSRRGGELERDIAHTDCQFVITDDSYAALLDGLAIDGRILNAATAEYEKLVAEASDSPPAAPAITVDESSLYLLVFTSGTTSAPKACRCSQGRMAKLGSNIATGIGLTADDVNYLAMPLFHSNGLQAGWTACLSAGSSMVLAERFSASAFLPDVRRYGVTYFNYVGKPMSYILAVPEQPDDADTPLRLVFGNEAAEADIDRFAARFGCQVIDGYGSTEGGVAIVRTPGMPRGALGRGGKGTVVLDPATEVECPPARFDAAGVLLNPDEAIGELASRRGAARFEGYWRNEEAERARVRDGLYWTGDLAYRDEEGFVYFAGRTDDWLRVDGENLASAPIERILGRHPDVVVAAVYAVPDPVTGDEVMVALQLRPEAGFDPDGFAAFLAAQPDLGPKWMPRYVRLVEQFPMTETGKVRKRLLRAEGTGCADPLWWRPDQRGRTWSRVQAEGGA